MIYITSDTHFGHEKVITLSKRPFKDVKEMNEEIIKRWNSVVRPNDEVYHLGDFAFWFKMEAGELQSIFDRLNGKKHLIIGNHDTKEIQALGWDSVQHYKKIRHNKQKYVLCHYPIEEWDGYFNGTVHLYGHTHNNKFDLPNRIHVGMDTQNWTPVLLDEVGLLNGEITKSDDRGVISVQNWKKGTLQGVSVVKTNRGEIISNYVDGKLDGEWVEKDDHGWHYLIKCNYKNGLLDGEYKKKHITKWGDALEKHEIIENYKDGKLHGEHKEFNENGYLTKVVVYDMGTPISKELLNNKTKMVKIKIPLANDREEVREYHNFGDVKALYELDNCGRKDGVFKKWFASGSLMQEAIYVKNRKNGKSIIYEKELYSEKTHKCQELNFVNNKEVGLQKTFRENRYNSQSKDTIYLESEYMSVDGKMHGKYVRYNNDGTEDVVGQYNKGQRTGVFNNIQVSDVYKKYDYYDSKGDHHDNILPMEEMKSINTTLYQAWKSGDKELIKELATIHQQIIVEDNYFITKEK